MVSCALFYERLLERVLWTQDRGSAHQD